MKIRALVIDDEPLARRSVRRHLDAEPDVEVIGECGDGKEAVAAICREEPDLVFLDIQMPEIDGFEVVQQVGVGRMPVTIFVTAYDRYALRAFEAHALDYLLKPFNKARFADALSHARQHIAGNLNREALRSVVELMGQVAGQNTYSEHLPVTQHGHVVLVHIANRKYEVRETLTAIEHKLNPLDFARIHRSTIVNVRSVKEIHPWFRGHHLVILKNGQELRMSRYQRDVARRLGVG